MALTEHAGWRSDTSQTERVGIRADRSRWLLAAVVAEVLLAAGLAAWKLGDKPIWADEADALSVARMPLDVILRPRLSLQSNLVLYGVFLKVWRLGGESATWLRLPSAVMAVAAVPVAVAIGRRIGGAAVGLLAGAFMVLTGFWVHFAQENKPYALTLLAATGAGWCLLRAVETGRWLFWAGWSIAGAVVVYGHPVAGAIVVGQAVALLALGRALPWRRAAVALAAFGALCVPQLLLAREESWQSRTSWIPPVTVDRLHEVVRIVLGSSGLRQLLVVALLVAAASVVASRRRDPFERFGVALVLSWALVPLVVVAITSRLIEPVLVPRYLVGSLPGLALAISIGLIALRRRALVAILAAVLLVTGAQTVRDQYATPKEDYRSAAELFGREARPADGVVSGHPFWRLPLEYYVLRKVPTDRRPAPLSPVEPWGTYPAQGGAARITPKRLAAYERIWLVGPPSQLGDPAQRIDAGHDLLDVRRFERVEVRLYVSDRKRPPPPKV